MKRTIVTGGAGFVGSHLCERLLSEGNNVVCLDNYFTGRKENISHLIDNPNFEVVEHDICEPYFTEADEIYNLACPASPVHYQSDRIKTLKTSVLGAINMLELAKRTGAKILQASTSEIYGDPITHHPQPEDYWGNVNPIGFRSCYDEGKRCAETLFTDYRRQNGVRTKIARIFNTYGTRMQSDDGRAVPEFIIQALRNEHITIHGDGSKTRSFQYVDDLIDGLIKLMATTDDIKGPVNIGNPEEFTISELAEKIIRLTNSESTIINLPPRPDDPRQRRPDITLAKKHLNWQPKIQLEQGLKKVIEYFSTQR
jgi:UDP-glucuronate decarboxylase